MRALLKAVAVALSHVTSAQCLTCAISPGHGRLQHRGPRPASPAGAAETREWRKRGAWTLGSAAAGAGRHGGALWAGGILRFRRRQRRHHAQPAAAVRMLYMARESQIWLRSFDLTTATACPALQGNQSSQDSKPCDWLEGPRRGIGQSQSWFSTYTRRCRPHDSALTPETARSCHAMQLHYTIGSVVAAGLRTTQRSPS